MTTNDADGDLPAILDIAEYAPGSAAVLDDDERWPALDESARARLHALRTHRHAPRWTHSTGDRLDAAAQDRVRRVDVDSDWLTSHLDAARRLPAYRTVRRRLTALEDFPTIRRDDLMADIAAFVPLDADLDRMVHGTSSGSTGHALVLPDDIEDTARTFWWMVDVVRGLGIDWRPRPDRMALAHVVRQRDAFTYASLISSFEHATMARLNLEPAVWPDRDAFLLDVDPQVVSGTPAALETLLRSPLAERLRPLALFSGATELAAGLRAGLERTFGVPVVDVYSLHETRPIGFSVDGGPFRLVRRRVLVEILDDADSPLPDGERGEIVVTAGENPLLPLVRYRTGDFGRLVEVDGVPAIADLVGREDVRFVSVCGREVPCVDLTQQLQRSGARGWTAHQSADGSVRVVCAGGDRGLIAATLDALLGFPVTVEQVSSLHQLGSGKPRRYRCDMRRTG